MLEGKTQAHSESGWLSCSWLPHLLPLRETATPCKCTSSQTVCHSAVVNPEIPSSWQNHRLKTWCGSWCCGTVFSPGDSWLTCSQRSRGSGPIGIRKNRGYLLLLISSCPILRLELTWPYKQSKSKQKEGNLGSCWQPSYPPWSVLRLAKQWVNDDFVTSKMASVTEIECKWRRNKRPPGNETDFLISRGLF